MDDEHRRFLRHLVQVFRLWMPSLGKLGIVVPESDDPAEPGDRLGMLRLPVPQDAEQRSDARRLSVGSRQQIRPERLEPHVPDMSVSVDESRQECSTPQIDEPGSGALKGERPGLLAHEQQRAVLHGNRFGILRRVALHRQDRPAGVDGVGCDRFFESWFGLPLTIPDYFFHAAGIGHSGTKIWTNIHHRSPPLETASTSTGGSANRVPRTPRAPSDQLEGNRFVGLLLPSSHITKYGGSCSANRDAVDMPRALADSTEPDQK